MTGASTRPVGWRDHLLGAVLAAVYIAVLLATADDLAMSRDEGVYTRAAETYGAWFEKLFEDPSAALERSFIDKRWKHNHEHPSLMKSLFALSLLAHDELDVFPTAGAAVRFPGMLAAGLVLWLLYLFGARAFDRRVGLFAAAAYALMPRPFYHAHLAAFDVPVVLMTVLVAYCYWRALHGKWWWLLALGVSYGLALATKHNAWVLPGVLLIHWGWVLAAEIRARRGGAPKRTSYVPWWLLSMAVLGPPLFVGLWPWLWHDTWPRFEWYASFHIDHAHYHFAYLGTSYWKPPFPVHVPFVLTAFTLPATTLLLAVVGMALRGRALLPDGVRQRLWARGGAEPDSRCTDVLWLGLALAPLVVIAMPETPIFGGTKHWFGAYPFFALFAGVAFRRLTQVLADKLPPRRVLVAAAAAGAGALLLTPAWVETAHSHPFGLAHYGVLAGGVPGAADKGMNRQFWGYTHGALGDWFARRAPDGARVWPCDATGKSWNMMRKDGLYPDNVRATGNMPRADFAIVHHEMHFREVDGQIWTAYGTVQPVHVLRYDGVPIVSVYENPGTRTPPPTP